MTLIKWTPEFETGNQDLDTQHRHLVDIVNKFSEAMHKGQDPRVMNEILNDLVGYTQEHFADEERIMSAADYTGLAAHQAKHRRLLQKIERFQFDFGQDGPPVTRDVESFLKDWLTAHVKKDDMAFVRSRRPEPVAS